MKSGRGRAAAVRALAIAGPALAQSVSTVNQSNTGNSANVEQTASLSGGDSLINQSGANNQANVSQGDDGSGATPINVSVIDQTGNSNLANVSQDTSTIAIQSDSYIGQSGSNNVADVTQVEAWQSSTINTGSTSVEERGVHYGSNTVVAG